MAERRMLARNLILFDTLADFSHSTQLLYIYMNLQADDEGFVGNPQPIIRMLSCGEACLQELINAGYLIRFDSGVVVVTHWYIHNQVRKDRFKATRHQEEKAQLTLTDSGLYILAAAKQTEAGCHLVAKMATQDRIDKDSIGKESIGKESIGKDRIDDSQRQADDRSSLSSYSDYENMILELYQRCCPGLPAFEFLPEELRKHIAQLEKAGWTGEYIEKAFRAAQGSEYLKGRGKDGWTADLWWLCKDDNLQKVLSGKYRTFGAPPGGAKNGNKPICGCNPLGEAELEAIQKLLRDSDPNFHLPSPTYS